MWHNDVEGTQRPANSSYRSVNAYYASIMKNGAVTPTLPRRPAALLGSRCDTQIAARRAPRAGSCVPTNARICPRVDACGQRLAC